MRKLFAVMPFGKRRDESEEGREINFDTVYGELIKAAGVAAGFSVLRIDEVASPGTISDQYLHELFESDIVIADITLPNPNVFYELGIRQAMGTGPTILLAHAGTKLPFDIQEQRVLFYELAPLSRLAAARANVENAIGNATAQSSSKNPVQRFLASIGAQTSPEEDRPALERELRGKIERAQNLNQLLAVWNWARKAKVLPALTLSVLATRFADAGDWTTAVDITRRAIQDRPEDFELHRNLGWFLRNQGEPHYQESERAFRESLRLNPADPEAIGMLAGLLKRQARFSDAARLYEQGALLAPTNYYMKVNRAGMALLAQPHNPREALELYRTLLGELEDLPPDGRDAWTEVMFAEACFVLGKDEEARNHFVEASRISNTPTVLRSPADQIEFFGSNGFRTMAAQNLSEWIRSLAKSLSKSAMSVIVDETAKPPRTQVGSIIIHLTDLHFGTRPGPDGKPVRMHRFIDGDDSLTLEDHLIREFTSTRRHFAFDGRPVILVVSGDFTYTATATEFGEALRFLEAVCAGLSIPKDRVILCPGNHDVNWAQSKIDRAQRFDQYVSFLHRFYGTSFRARYPLIKWDLTIDSERPRPTDLVSLQVLPAEGLLLLSLNSCVYETEEHHYGYVSSRQLRNVEDLLDQVTIDRNLVRVAVLHHHLHPYPEPVKLEPSGEHWHDQSTSRDAALVEKYLEKHGFDIVLHGHKHKPQLRETLLRDPNFPTGVRPLIVFGGGSCGVDSRELEHNIPNHYEVLEFLNAPRVHGAEFLRVEWRTLDVSPGADWVTAQMWTLPG